MWAPTQPVSTTCVALGHTLFGFILVLIVILPGRAAYGEPSFSVAAPLNTNAAADGGRDILPVIATDGTGNWVAVWTSTDTLGDTLGGDYDILLARSTDNGLTWTNPAPLNNTADTDSDDDLYPVVATDGDRVWITAWFSAAGILLARSTDNALNWSDPIVVSIALGSRWGGGDYPEIAADGNDNWLVVWEATDENLEFDVERDILVIRSTDDGLNWTAPVPLNSIANSDSGGGDTAGIDDTRPVVATDRHGNWVVAWEWRAGFVYDADLSVARSSDNGATWSEMEFLNSNWWNDSGADFGPDLATDGLGNWVAVWWSTDKVGLRIGKDFDILVARSKNNGKTWSWPKPLNTNAWTDSRGDYVPAIATDRLGNWVAVWESDDTLGGTIGEDDDILVAYSTSSGARWTDPVPLNSNAAMDSRIDGGMGVAPDGHGNWVSAWHSKDSLGETIGTDFDILCATANIPTHPLILTSPNGGEGWKAGSSHTIRWVSTEVGVLSVKLELLRNGGVIQVIESSTPNDGEYEWDISAETNPGKGYRVRVTSTTASEISDRSDKGFRINAAP